MKLLSFFFTPRLSMFDTICFTLLTALSMINLWAYVLLIPAIILSAYVEIKVKESLNA